ncbi:hypothetical protein F442_10191 [Phytophthora nicotianae P10297]|uniref:Uncharacterized protein n=1 Tax=Phytophthora nicotianae P10297 TaxID=1317064 RepID=W2Z7J0_PHYNI|nr:hypothetical protein F442_10191 [Phytophthora nicotianae P10297]
MLKRYVEIRDAIKMVQAAEDLVPRTSSHRRIVQLLSKLGDLDSSTAYKVFDNQIRGHTIQSIYEAIPG